MRRTMLSATVVTKTIMSISLAFAQGGPANWQDLALEGGSSVKIDLNSISRYGNGAVDVVVYFADGSGYNPENMHRLWFDCQGRYQDLTGPHVGPSMHVPPLSIIGKVSETACGAMRKASSEPTVSEKRNDPTQYCSGLPRDACDRILKATEREPKPVYCKPGFGLVGNGLSLEQVRICSAITSNEVSRAQPTNTNNVARARSYEMTLWATHDKYPNIVGSTNLPNGTKLLVSIEKPRLANAEEKLADGLPKCEDDCFPASGPKGEVLGVETTVLAKAFSAGPFSWNGKPILKGSYKVEIFLVALPGEDVRNREIYEKQLERMKVPVFSQTVDIAP